MTHDRDSREAPVAGARGRRWRSLRPAQRHPAVLAGVEAGETVVQGHQPLQVAPTQNIAAVPDSICCVVSTQQRRLSSYFELPGLQPAHPSHMLQRAAY